MSLAYLICGPPGSGKTTYVKEHMIEGDLVVDLDAIASALAGGGHYARNGAIRDAALLVKEMLLSQPFDDVRAIWLIDSGQTKKRRDKIRGRLTRDPNRRLSVVMLEVPASECIKRILRDERRAKRAEQWKEIVYKWWRDYEPE